MTPKNISIPSLVLNTFLFYICAQQVHCCNAKKHAEDYYTSLIGVKNLVKKEQQIVQQVVRYRRKLIKRLDLINQHLDDYTSSVYSAIKRNKGLRLKYERKAYPIFENEKELEAVSDVVSSNPLLAFRLLRRFTKDLTDLAVHTMSDKSDEGFKEFIENIPEELTLPTETDLNGAADGILRLQETYQLSTYDLVKGKIIDKNTGCALRASDLHLLGIRAFNDHLFATSAEWLFSALQLVQNGDASIPIDIIRAHFEQARLHLNEEIFNPYTVNIFSGWINSTGRNIPELYKLPYVKNYEIGHATESKFDVLNFNALCRGEKLLTLQQSKTFRCWYSFTAPYHIISPLKYEMHHENPPVYQIYDLISDKVINHLKNMSQDNLMRAKVAVGSGMPSDIRTSSVAWLMDTQDSLDETMLKVPKIVKSMTGLKPWSPEAAEQLQISCYGAVGGFYVPHMDALFGSDAPIETFQGDRIATIMFYLSDVEMGGGTAFPRLGIASEPVKGSAMLWYNLKYNGEKDNRMLHGGCPVLYGNKWVANKWIRHNAQVHIRKCRMNPLE